MGQNRSPREAGQGTPCRCPPGAPFPETIVSEGEAMDEAKLHEFMGKLVTDMGGAAMIANVILGEELWLYRAMADSALSHLRSSRKTGCNARLMREWLSAQAAAGMSSSSRANFGCPPSRPWRWRSRTRRSSSPAARRCWRACSSTRTSSSPPCAAMVPSRGASTTRRCLAAQSAFSGPATARIWWPSGSRPGGRRPQARGGRHGRGYRLWAWGLHGPDGPGLPRVPLFGFDYHAPSIATAQQRARTRGRRPRDLRPGDGQGLPRPDYDLICFFDCLHDMGDPVGAARMPTRR